MSKNTGDSNVKRASNRRDEPCMVSKGLAADPAFDKGGVGVGGCPLSRVVLTVPIVPIDDRAYISTHVDVQLTSDQARGLRRVFNALHREAIKLDNGRFVQSPPDAVRWLLERIEELDRRKR